MGAILALPRRGTIDCFLPPSPVVICHFPAPRGNQVKPFSHQPPPIANPPTQCEVMLTEECVSGPGGPLGCVRSVLPRLGPGGVVLAPPTNSSLIPGVAPEVILGGSGTVPGVPGQAGGPGQGSMGAPEGATGAVGSGGRGGRGGGGGGGALTGGEVAGVVLGVVGGELVTLPARAD